MYNYKSIFTKNYQKYILSYLKEINSIFSEYKLDYCFGKEISSFMFHGVMIEIDYIDIIIPTNNPIKYEKIMKILFKKFKKIKIEFSYYDKDINNMRFKEKNVYFLDIKNILILKLKDSLSSDNIYKQKGDIQTIIKNNELSLHYFNKRNQIDEKLYKEYIILYDTIY